MGEKKGLIFTIFIITCFLLPFLLQIYVLSVVTDHFMKATTEVTQMIKVNGGYTKNVQEAVSQMTLGGKSLADNNAMTITVNDADSDSGKKEVGRYVTVNYKYTYMGMYGIEYEFNTTSNIVMDKR